MVITLDQVEKEYQREIEQQFSGEKLTAEKLIDISVSLFHALKVENIPVQYDPDCDMLLFQYGIYDWGGQFGRHFGFDITRQFITEDNDEPYQLSFSLIYEPDIFQGCAFYGCWSSKFARLEDWVEHIKTTQGFLMAKEALAKTYTLTFGEC